MKKENFRNIQSYISTYFIYKNILELWVRKGVSNNEILLSKMSLDLWSGYLFTMWWKIKRGTFRWWLFLDIKETTLGRCRYVKRTLRRTSCSLLLCQFNGSRNVIEDRTNVRDLSVLCTIFSLWWSAFVCKNSFWCWRNRILIKIASRIIEF